MIGITCYKCSRKMAVREDSVVTLTCSVCGCTACLIRALGAVVTLQCQKCGVEYEERTNVPVNTFHKCQLGKPPNTVVRKNYLLKINPAQRIKSAQPFKGQTISKKETAVSIVIVCFNLLEKTKKCITRVRDAVEVFGEKIEIVLVDNGSTDGTLKWAQQQKDITYVRNRINLGCALGRNQGAQWSGGEKLLFLDNDQYISSTYIKDLYERDEDIVGSEHWRITEKGRVARQRQRDIGMASYLGSGGMMVKRSVFLDLGGYDERFAPAWYADVDFCFRAKLGGHSLAVVGKKVEHEGGQTVESQKNYDSPEEKEKSRILFDAIWGSYVERGTIPEGYKPLKQGIVLVKRRILLMVDVQGWAWWNKSLEIRKFLGGKYDIDIWAEDYGTGVPEDYDLYITFAPRQLRFLQRVEESKKVVGITSHPGFNKWVRGTKEWNSKVRAFHVNSLMLHRLVEGYHSKIFYVPNGVDLKLFPVQPFNNHEELVVGFVGRVNDSDDKGLQVIRTAAEELEGVRLLVNRRDHRSKVPLDEMAEQYYKEIDVLAVASVMDGTPNPMLEAAACGRSVVANEIGNVPEFVENGVNGFIVKRASEEYRSIFVQLRDEKGKAEEMGKRARHVVADWSWEKQVGYYDQMFQELL